MMFQAVIRFFRTAVQKIKNTFGFLAYHVEATSRKPSCRIVDLDLACNEPRIAFTVLHKPVRIEKTASELFQDPALLNRFSARDGALIGIVSTLVSENNQIEQVSLAQIESIINQIGDLFHYESYHKSNPFRQTSR